MPINERGGKRVWNLCQAYGLERSFEIENNGSQNYLIISWSPRTVKKWVGRGKSGNSRREFRVRRLTRSFKSSKRFRLDRTEWSIRSRLIEHSCRSSITRTSERLGSFNTSTIWVVLVEQFQLLEWSQWITASISQSNGSPTVESGIQWRRPAWIGSTH